MTVQFTDVFLSGHPGIAETIRTGLVEGVPFTLSGDGADIRPGDTDIAERNSGLKLLTCRQNDVEHGWVLPEEIAYPFDTFECFQVELHL
ncbi:hypothetical protein [Curtobacterium sp. MCBD17_040]|uniref:hypothetical protein n=1 Tax=Curtobacterium sp. MCBD17_040 TaxID=2175674 RepID=UPI000DAA4727|nr:hypothetical protein [Curtobacterium sp. MCBD17_040]WIB65830.1 hypothetical protein DEI94_17095 [Curtobacterium sp. MCBD17_040]